MLYRECHQRDSPLPRKRRHMAARSLLAHTKSSCLTCGSNRARCQQIRGPRRWDIHFANVLSAYVWIDHSWPSVPRTCRATCLFYKSSWSSRSASRCFYSCLRSASTACAWLWVSSCVLLHRAELGVLCQYPWWNERCKRFAECCWNERPSITFPSPWWGWWYYI